MRCSPTRHQWIIAASLAAATACSGSPELKALCAAVESSNIEEVRRLLQAGNVNLNDDQHATGLRCRPFAQAMAKVVPEKLTSDRSGLEIVRLMLDARADASSCWLQPSADRRQPEAGERQPTVFLCAINYAVRSQSGDFVRLVLERGGNVKGGGGASALREAASQGDLAVVKTLVEAGAPLNEVASSETDPGSEGTALGAAVRGFHDEVVAYLESLPGAREFSVPSASSGTVTWAARAVGGAGNLTAAEQAFMSAARHGDLAAVNRALANGIDVDRLDDDSMSGLMRAAGWGRGPIVEALLKAGAKPDLMTGGKTALHLAAERGQSAVIRLLVGGKANIQARLSETDDTPLFAAVKADQPDAVRALIDAGADTSASDASMTPLEYAIWRADTAVVRELVKNGRSLVNRRHASAQASPLHGALWCKNPDYNVQLIETLVGAGADLSAVDQNGDTPMKAVARKRAAETEPYYQACYDAQLAALRAAPAR